MIAAGSRQHKSYFEDLNTCFIKTYEYVTKVQGLQQHPQNVNHYYKRKIILITHEATRRAK